METTIKVDCNLIATLICNFIIPQHCQISVLQGFKANFLAHPLRFEINSSSIIFVHGGAILLGKKIGMS